MLVFLSGRGDLSRTATNGKQRNTLVRITSRGHAAMAQDRGLQAAGREQAPAQLKVLAKLVNGCKDNLEGKSAKTSIVMSFISSSGEDPLGVLCWLHTEKAVTVDIVELLRRVRARTLLHPFSTPVPRDSPNSLPISTYSHLFMV